MSRVVLRAQQLGYVVLGWGIMDYARDAIDNHGWESYIIWGPKGGYKSNLLLQIGYNVYGDVENEGYENMEVWETVLNHIIFTPMDFIRITKDKGRIPFLGWDDISAHLPRTLYMTNRKLWDAVARNWDLFRPKLSVFVCTTPHKSRVASFIVNDMSGEIIVSKGHKFEHQRWSWDLDLKHHDSEQGKPIKVEEAKTIHRDNVPLPIWSRYWARRMELSEGAHQELIKLFTKLEGKKKEQELPKELAEMTPKERRTWAGRILRTTPHA